MSAPSISAVIITYNEAENISGCISAIKPAVQEIIVVDSFSTDNTIQIAEKLGAKVYQHKWEGYAQTKNYANALCSSEFIISLDADEVVSDQLLASITKVDLQRPNAAYSFNRLTNYCGTFIKHAGWYPDRKLRFFRKNDAKWEGEHVHEKLILNQGVREIELQGNLLHYSYNSKQEHVDRERKYAALAAEQKPQRSAVIAYLSYASKFLRMYILKYGFVYGSLGFQLCHIAAKGKIWKYQYSTS
ncbi:MAG: glycosyltransferase family 2 protein [Bacteroidia bacterium]